MGKYKILKKLGEGSFGTVFLVEDEKDHGCYVLKQISLTGMTAQELADCKKEISILSLLSHQNIVKYIRSFTTKSTLCIVMEFADGGDLQKEIEACRDAKKFFDEDKVLTWFTQVACALEHVHSLRILHRDLKTQNIFLMKNGDVKLGDFGISRVLNGTMDKATTLVGTPYYLSPEMVNGQPYNQRTDIWALGVVLYEMLTLQRPFQADSLQMLVLKIIAGDYPPIPSQYSDDMRSLLGHCLQQDPNKRYTIEQVLEYPLVKKKIKQLGMKTLHEEEKPPEEIAVSPASPPEVRIPKGQVDEKSPVPLSPLEAPSPKINPPPEPDEEPPSPPLPEPKTVEVKKPAPPPSSQKSGNKAPAVDRQVSAPQIEEPVVRPANVVNKFASKVPSEPSSPSKPPKDAMGNKKEANVVQRSVSAKIEPVAAAPAPKPPVEEPKEVKEAVSEPVRSTPPVPPRSGDDDGGKRISNTGSRPSKFGAGPKRFSGVGSIKDKQLPRVPPGGGDQADSSASAPAAVAAAAAAAAAVPSTSGRNSGTQPSSGTAKKPIRGVIDINVAQASSPATNGKGTAIQTPKEIEEDKQNELEAQSETMKEKLRRDRVSGKGPSQNENYVSKSDQVKILRKHLNERLGKEKLERLLHVLESKADDRTKAEQIQELTEGKKDILAMIHAYIYYSKP